MVVEVGIKMKKETKEKTIKYIQGIEVSEEILKDAEKWKGAK